MGQPGMSLVKAMEMGQRIKRRKWDHYIDLPTHLTRDDYLAMDWEVLERTIEISEAQLNAVLESLRSKLRIAPESFHYMLWTALQGEKKE